MVKRNKRSFIAFTAENQPKSSTELVAVVRELVGNKILLSFSGKDSLAMWLFLREQGFEIIPYTLYTVPGLSFEDEARTYYEKFFGTKIYNLPHPYFYMMLRQCEFQPPTQAKTLMDCNLAEYDFADLEALIAAENGLDPENFFSAVGYLASDSLGRRSFINLQGPLGFARRSFYFAIWDWSRQQVMDAIHKAGVALPRHYRIWGNTGTGRPFEYLGLHALKQKSPADYERVKKWFPLIDLEFFRYEQVK
jgi:hypothetical protein